MEAGGGKTKYIFVTGGVVSSLGKGVTGASLGRLLKARGYAVSMMKFDPYINVDPGTMNPFQHGEVFVTDGGVEADLDLGHYERFADVSLGQGHDITTGKIYSDLIEKERRGFFMGGTLQTIPHVTGAIKDAIFAIAKRDDPDFLIVEIGGTVGDIEGLPFLEAIAQMPRDVGRKNCFFLHVTLVPYLKSAGELKTKPTQHSVLRELGSVGIRPDALVCRCEQTLDDGIRHKIAFLCNLKDECVIENQDMSTIYEVPLILESQGLPRLVLNHVGLPNPEPDLLEWREMVHRLTHPERSVTIAVVGKYVGLKDAYCSVSEALVHGGCHHKAKVEVRWVESEDIASETVESLLQDADGILVPGGFGERGMEGMITAIQWARRKKIPFLGIGLGMQMAIVEYARNEKEMPRAHSTEMDRTTPDPVVCLMDEQFAVTPMAGAMRLGSYGCEILPGTLLERIYGTTRIVERHRHRYEFNPRYVERLTDGVFCAAGFQPEVGLCEAIELKGHPFFVGVQFHPEFQSRPNRPHPLFREFLSASLGKENEGRG